MVVHTDYILKDIGEYGRFQRFQTLLLCLFTIFFSFQMLSLRYIAEVPETFCYVPEVMSVHSYYGYLDYQERITLGKLTIPWDLTPSFLQTRTSLIDSCRRYNINSTFKVGDSLVGVSTIPCDNGYVYHNMEIQSVSTEWDLVCDNRWKAEFAQSMFMSGLLVGSVIGGNLGDLYDYLKNVKFILGLEFIGPNRRALYAAFKEAAYTFGHLLLAGIGYTVRDWRLLQFFVSFPAIFILIVWPYVINCVYYGISIGTDDLFGDRYLDLLFNGALSLPANFSFILAIARFGRRRPLSVYFCVGGVSLLILSFIPKSLNLLGLILRIISRFTVLAAIGICIVYAAELFPTPVSYRGAGIGITVTFARLGGITAPLLWLRALRNWEGIPMIVFGILSIIAGSLVLILPETVGRNLPETMEEGEQYGK
ncbi:solute carrier family 22 member 1-like [Antedon mediterranea]|uniref:solute carrier family 22 member 1-like n=1 Tax=Antedon mediterranea TaxID=105859 RepID=UPI003AF71BC4